MVIQSDRNHGTFSVSDPKKKFRKEIIIEFVISIQFELFNLHDILTKRKEKKKKKKVVYTYNSFPSRHTIVSLSNRCG